MDDDIKRERESGNSSCEALVDLVVVVSPSDTISKFKKSINIYSLLLKYIHNHNLRLRR